MKKIISSILAISICFGICISTNNTPISAEEQLSSLVYRSPYPEHQWINLGTITLTPVQINSAVDIRNKVYGAISSFVGAVGGVVNTSIINAIQSSFNSRHYTFYIQLTQYVSTDYKWHYYTYTVYQNAACTQAIGTYISTKWMDRNTKSHEEEELM